MTQTETIRAVREIIRNERIGSLIDQDHPEFGFLRDLFDRHPERVTKYGPGLAGFKVVRNAYGKRALDIVRVDGSTIDASFYTAARGTPNPVSRNLRDAMRGAVADDIRAFREAAWKPEATCGVCGKSLGGGLTHVDHHAPTFEELAQTYITEHPDHPTTFADSADNSSAFRVEDASYAASWRSFHQTNAVLRLVHSRCNLTRRN